MNISIQLQNILREHPDALRVPPPIRTREEARREMKFFRRIWYRNRVIDPALALDAFQNAVALRNQSR